MLNNVPLSTQSLGQTQSLIQANFSTINTAFGINHVTYNDGSGNQGKHNLVDFPVQGSVPTFATGDTGFYNLNYATTSTNETYIHKITGATTADIPFTASVLSANATPTALSAGWTYLPSGLLLKWGPSQNGNGLTNVVVNGSGNGPDFTFMIVAFPIVEASSTSDSNSFVRLVAGWSIPANNYFQVYCSARTSTGAGSCGFTWWAIGY
jgi:hypothetical protein